MKKTNFITPVSEILNQYKKSIVEKTVSLSVINDLCEVVIVNSPIINYFYVDYDKENLSAQEHRFNLDIQFIEFDILNEDMKYLSENPKHIINTIISELSEKMFTDFMNLIETAATKNCVNEFTRWDKIKISFYNLFKKKYKKYKGVKNSKHLLDNIKFESNKIYKNTKLGFGDFIICSMQTADFLLKSENKKYYKINANKNTEKIIYFIAEIAGLQIYVNPRIRPDDKTIYIGRKSTKDHSGIKLFLDIDKVDIITHQQTLHRMKILFRLRYSILAVGNNSDKLYRKLVYKIK